jgi:hypothetical protein
MSNPWNIGERTQSEGVVVMPVSDHYCGQRSVCHSGEGGAQRAALCGT